MSSGTSWDGDEGRSLSRRKMGREGGREEEEEEEEEEERGLFKANAVNWEVDSECDRATQV